MGQGRRGVVGALGALGVLAAACGASTYIFAGRRFDPARGCVETIAQLATLDGLDPGAVCDPICLLGPADADGGVPLYVTSECPPYPRLFESTGTSPDCLRALDVYAHGPACVTLDAGGAADAARD